VILFDWYGTLVPLGPLDMGCDAFAPGRGAEFAATWRARQLEASWLRTIMGRWVDFDTVTAEALTVTLANFDLDADADERWALVRAFLELPVSPDAAEVITELRRRGTATGVLGNGSRGTLERGVARASLPVDHIFSADDVQVFKPHPAVYRQAQSATNAPLSEIRFVTANGWDAAGAAAFGFRVLWLQPDDSAQPPAVGAPAVRTGSWADVSTF
jgi:2-haloacid dehalogenase